MVTDTAVHPFGTSILSIQDFSIPAGYCKLQLVQDGVPRNSEAPDAEASRHIYFGHKLQFTTDSNNQLVCRFTPSESKLRVYDQRHGEAMTSNETTFYNILNDTVHTVVCNNTSHFKQDQKIWLAYW